MATAFIENLTKVLIVLSLFSVGFSFLIVDSGSRYGVIAGNNDTLQSLNEFQQLRSDALEARSNLNSSDSQVVDIFGGFVRRIYNAGKFLSKGYDVMTNMFVQSAGNLGLGFITNWVVDIALVMILISIIFSLIFAILKVKI